MAPLSRQERLQMRQRGAGARKVDNVDFGFSFGLTPVTVDRSARRTPQPPNTSIRRSSRTPSRNGRGSSAQRSVRSESAAIYNGEVAPTGPPENESTDTEEPAAKRRKGDDGHYSQPTTPVDQVRAPAVSVGPSLTGSSNHTGKLRRRTSGPAFVQIAEDPEGVYVPEQLAPNSMVSKGLGQRVQEREVEVATLDKENSLPHDKLGKKSPVVRGKQKRTPKQRRSLGQQSGHRKERLSGEPVQHSTEDLLQDQAAPELVAEDSEWETMIGNESNLLPVEGSKPTARHQTVKTKKKKKRRKRKSIVFRPRNRRRSGESNTQGVMDTAEIPRDSAADSGGALEQDVQADRTPSVQPTVVTRRRFSDTSKITTPGNGPTYEPETEGDETYIDEPVSPEKPTPKAPTKKAKAKARKGSRPESDGRSSSSRKADGSSIKKSSKSCFPILTHRMANISALPTITEEVYDDLDSAGDPTSQKTMFTDRSAPNAVDVLAQVCRETISTTISKLRTSSNTGNARLQKRRRSALEAFSAEIDARLSDMSVAVEHRLTMEARVKKAKKAKIDAQNEWMAIRRQREQIALRCDDVRARNQQMEAKGKQTYELSEQLHALEMVVEKPDLDECGTTDGLEYLLRSVATTVSGAAAASDGLLARVREYNLQLERTALMLEGRELD